MYKHCKNCIYSKEYSPHRNFVTGGWNYLYCVIKHKYVNSHPKINAIMCKSFKNTYKNYHLDLKVLKPNYPVYIVNKKDNLRGWVLIDYIDNKEKTIHCYYVENGNLYDDVIKFDDYFFYDHEI